MSFLYVFLFFCMTKTDGSWNNSIDVSVVAVEEGPRAASRWLNKTTNMVKNHEIKKKTKRHKMSKLEFGQNKLLDLKIL